MDPSQKIKLLKLAGKDPNQWDVSEDGNYYIPRPTQPQQASTAPDLTTIAPLKTTTALQAASTHALGSVLPTAAGFAGGIGIPAAALALAPETGGLSLLALGLAGGIGGSMLGSKAQEPLLTDKFKQQLATTQEEHPVASTIGGFIPSAAVFNPVSGLRNLPTAAGALGKLATGTSFRGLPMQSRQILQNLAVNEGVGAGQDIYNQATGDKPFNYGQLATTLAGSALLTEPNRMIGQRIGFHPSGPLEHFENPALATQARQPQTTITPDLQRAFGSFGQPRGKEVGPQGQVIGQGKSKSWAMNLEQPDIATLEGEGGITGKPQYESQQIEEYNKALAEKDAQNLAEQRKAKAELDRQEASMLASENATRALQLQNKLRENQVADSNSVKPLVTETDKEIYPDYTGTTEHDIQQNLVKPKTEAERIQEEYDRLLPESNLATPNWRKATNEELKPGAYVRWIPNNEHARQIWNTQEGTIYGNSHREGTGRKTFQVIDKSGKPSNIVWLDDGDIEILHNANEERLKETWANYQTHFREWAKNWKWTGPDPSETYNNYKAKTSLTKDTDSAVKAAIAEARKNGPSAEFRSLFGGIEPSLAGTTSEKVAEFAKNLGLVSRLSPESIVKDKAAELTSEQQAEITRSQEELLHNRGATVEHPNELLAGPNLQGIPFNKPIAGRYKPGTGNIEIAPPGEGEGKSGLDTRQHEGTHLTLEQYAMSSNPADRELYYRAMESVGWTKQHEQQLAQAKDKEYSRLKAQKVIAEEKLADAIALAATNRNIDNLYGTRKTQFKNWFKDFKNRLSYHLGNEGAVQDYLARAYLKDAPVNQRPELRAWADNVIASRGATEAGASIHKLAPASSLPYQHPVSGNQAFVSKSPTEDKYQLTLFGKDKQPTGHMKFDNEQGAHWAAKALGYEQSKELHPDTRITVQQSQLPDKSDKPWVQVDMHDNSGSTNPEKLREQGYNIPSSEELLKLPMGQYKLKDIGSRYSEEAKVPISGKNKDEGIPDKEKIEQQGFRSTMRDPEPYRTEDPQYQTFEQGELNSVKTGKVTDKERKKALKYAREGYANKQAIEAHLGEASFKAAKESEAEQRRMTENLKAGLPLDTQDLYEAAQKAGKKAAELDAFTRPDVERHSPYSIIPMSAAQNDKVRVIDPKVGEALDKMALGKNLLEAQFIHTPMAEMPRATREEFGNAIGYIRDMFRDKSSSRTLSSKEQSIVDTWQPVLKDVAQQRKDAKLLVEDKGGRLREGSVSEHYLPDMPSDKTLELLTRKIHTPEAQSAIKDWAQHVHDENPSISLEEAEKNIRGYADSLGVGGMHSIEFNALRKAQGYGIPESLRELDPVKLLTKYGRRAANDLSYWKNLQSDPYVAARLGLPSREGGTSTQEGVTTIHTHPDVQGALRFLTNSFSSRQSPRFVATIRAITNGLLGTGTGVRNTAQLPALISPYFNSYRDVRSLFTAFNHLADARKASLDYGARSGTMDFDRWHTLSSPDAYTENMNKLAEVLRKYSGRDAMEQGDRIYTFAVAKEILKNNLADASYIKKFSLGIDKPVAEWTEHELNLAAKNFTDKVQGTYDARGLPVGVMDSQYAPFFSLSRWSIEKANTIWKDVIQPAAKGENYLPLLTYTLGTAMTGVAIRRLNELMSGKKDYTPSVQESLTEDRKDYAIAALVNLMQQGSYAGIIGDTAKSLSDVFIQHEYPKGPVSFPAADLVTQTLGQNLSNWMTAMENGGGFDSTVALISNIAKGSLQNYRLLNSRVLNAEDTERQNKFRDMRTFKKLEGENVPPLTAMTGNPLDNLSKREFKRTSDMQQAVTILPELISKALKDSGGDPYKLKRELEGIKENNYQSFPDLKSAPLSFVKYIKYLSNTQGPEEASKRLVDFMTQGAINKAKASMVPSL